MRRRDTNPRLESHGLLGPLTHSFMEWLSGFMISQDSSDLSSKPCLRLKMAKFGQSEQKKIGFFVATF